MSNTVKIAVCGSPAIELESIVATAEIIPGNLLLRNAATTVVSHDVAGGSTGTLFAVEDKMTGGASLTGSFVEAVNVPYAVGAKVYMIYARPGDVVWAWLNIGENVAVGEFLVSAGNGNLEAYAGPLTVPSAIVGVALEAVNAVATARIKIEIR